MQFVLKGHLYCAAGGDTGQGVSAIIPWKLPSYYSSFMPGEGGRGGDRGRVGEGGKIGFSFRRIVCTLYIVRFPDMKTCKKCVGQPD